MSALARVMLAWRARCVRVVRASASTNTFRSAVCTAHIGTFSLCCIDRLGGAARHTYIKRLKIHAASRILDPSQGVVWRKLRPENPLSEIRSGFHYHNEDPLII